MVAEAAGDDSLMSRRADVLMALLPAALLALPVGTAAQDDAPQSRDALVREYFARVGADGLAGAAEYLDPVGLAELRDLFADVVELELRAGGGNLGRLLFEGDVDPQSLRTMAPVAFYRRFLGFYENQLQRSNVRIRGGDFIGTVDETPARAFAVVRVHYGIGPGTLSTVKAVELVERSGRWFIGVEDDILNMVRAMGREVTGQPVPPGNTGAPGGP